MGTLLVSVKLTDKRTGRELVKNLCSANSVVCDPGLHRD